MFESHFGLRENPFSTGHDPRFVYPSPEHLEAVAHFRYGVQNREAFVLVTGEVGTGKTTAVRDLVARLPQQAHVALLQNTSLTRHELLEEVCHRFAVPWDPSLSKPALLERLETALGERLDRGDTCLLIIDEAQNLSNDLLEEIRLLSNLEWRGGHLVHICLAGQPELEERLGTPELRQLRQRISVKYRIKPLDAQETERYVHHRLRVAGGDGPRIFPGEAAVVVHEVAHGIPREINIVAAQALLNAFVEGSPVVRPQHVRQVVEEFGFQSVLARARPTLAPAPAAPAAPPPALPPPPSAPGLEQPTVAPVSPRPAVASTPQPARPPRPLAEPVAPAAAAPAPQLVPPAAPSAPPERSQPAAARTVGNWRERPAGPVVLPREPQERDDLVRARPPESVRALPAEPARARSAGRVPAPSAEPGPSLWSRIPLWVPIVGVVLVAAVVFLASGTGGRLWRSAASTAVEEHPSAPPPEAIPIEPQATPLPAGAPAPTAQQQAPAAASYAIQVASFRTEAKARATLAELQAATGLGGSVVTAVAGQSAWHRVLLGKFGTADEASAVGDSLRARGAVPADRMVVPAGQ